MKTNNRTKTIVFIALFASLFLGSFIGLSLMDIPQNPNSVIPSINESVPDSYGTSQTDELLSLDVLDEIMYDQNELNILDTFDFNLMNAFFGLMSPGAQPNETMLDNGSTFTPDEIRIKVKSNNISLPEDVSNDPNMLLAGTITQRTYVSLPYEILDLLSSLTDLDIGSFLNFGNMAPSSIYGLAEILFSLQDYLGLIPQGTESLKTSFDLTVNSFSHTENYTVNGFSMVYLFIQTSSIDVSDFGIPGFPALPISAIKLNFGLDSNINWSSIPEQVRSMYLLDNLSFVQNINVMNESDITLGETCHIEYDLMELWKDYFYGNGYCGVDQPALSYLGYIMTPFSFLGNESWSTENILAYPQLPWQQNGFDLDYSISNYKYERGRSSLEYFPVGNYDNSTLGININQYPYPGGYYYPNYTQINVDDYALLYDQVKPILHNITHNATKDEPWVTLRINDTNYVGIDFANWEGVDSYNDYHLLKGYSSWAGSYPLRYSGGNDMRFRDIFTNESIYGREYEVHYTNGVGNSNNTDAYHYFIQNDKMDVNMRATNNITHFGMSSYNRTISKFIEQDPWTEKTEIPLYSDLMTNISFRWKMHDYSFYSNSKIDGNYSSSLGVFGATTEYNNNNYTLYYLWAYNDTITDYITNDTYNKYLLLSGWELNMTNISWNSYYNMNFDNFTGTFNSAFGFHPSNITEVMTPAVWIYYNLGNVSVDYFKIRVEVDNLEIVTGRGKPDWFLYDLDVVYQFNIDESTKHQDYAYGSSTGEGHENDKGYTIDWEEMKYMEITFEDVLKNENTGTINWETTPSVMIWNNDTDDWEHLYDVKINTTWDDNDLNFKTFNNPKDYVISSGETGNDMYSETGISPEMNYNTSWIRFKASMNTTEEPPIYEPSFWYLFDFLNFEIHTTEDVFINHTIRIAPEIENLKVFVDNDETMTYTFDGETVKINLANWYDTLNSSRNLYNSFDPLADQNDFLKWQTPFVKVTYQYDYNITLTNFSIEQVSEPEPINANGTQSIDYDISFNLNHPEDLGVNVFYTFGFKPPNTEYLTHTSITANGTEVDLYNTYELTGWLSASLQNPNFSYPTFRVGLKQSTNIVERISVPYNITLYTTMDTWITDTIETSGRNRTYAFDFDTFCTSYVFENISIYEEKLPVSSINSIHSGLGRSVTMSTLSGKTVFTWSNFHYNETEVMEINYDTNNGISISILDDLGNPINNIEFRWELYIENTNILVGNGTTGSSLSISGIIPEMCTLKVFIGEVVIIERHYIDLSYGDTYTESINTHISAVSIQVDGTTMVFIGLGIGAGIVAGIWGITYLVNRYRSPGKPNKLKVDW